MVSREELDRQYSPSQWSHKFEPDKAIANYMTVTRQGSESVREKVRHDLDSPVPGSNQTVDIYWPDYPMEDCNAVLVFVHGGNWQACTKTDQGYLAPSFTSQKVIVVAVEYSIAPRGKIVEMVDQVRLALVHLRQRFGSRRMCVVGHSAGAHLVAMAACCKDPRCEGSKPVPVDALVLVSGIFDLDPIQKSYVNDELHLSAEEAHLLSPAHQRDCLSSVRGNLVVLVVMAEHDSLEYRCQSLDYAEMLRSHGVRVLKVMDIDDEDHFSIVENLSTPTFSLTKAILRMLREPHQY